MLLFGWFGSCLAGQENDFIFIKKQTKRNKVCVCVCVGKGFVVVTLS